MEEILATIITGLVVILIELMFCINESICWFGVLLIIAGLIILFIGLIRAFFGK